MAKVEIYTKDYCPYCVKAMNLLKVKGAGYTEYDVTGDADKLKEMLTRSGGRRTVPQIFINDVSVGGSDDLHKLDAEGKLDGLLNG